MQNLGQGDPVMFAVSGGIRENATTNVSGKYDSPAGETAATGEAYKIPPVVWPIVFLIVGYLGVRWIMED